MEMDFNSIIPSVGMKELLTSVFKMFNLYVEVDPNNENNLLIETRDDFLLSRWHKGLDVQTGKR
jgi:hypothetical protein